MTFEEGDFWTMLSDVERQAMRLKAETEHDGADRILRLIEQIRDNKWIVRNKDR